MEHFGRRWLDPLVARKEKPHIGTKWLWVTTLDAWPSLCGAALGVVGVALLITQDALFTRISGGLLIASSACFGVALHYRWQSGEQTLGPHID